MLSFMRAGLKAGAKRLNHPDKNHQLKSVLAPPALLRL